MAFLMLNQVAAIGASRAVKLARGVTDHFIEVTLEPTTTTDFTVCEVELQGGFDNPSACQSTQAVLGIGSTATRVKNTNAFYYQIDGTNYTIAAGAAGTAHTGTNGTAVTAEITDAKYGGLNVYANTSGALVTNPPPGYGVADLQAYDSAALCLAALKLAPTPSGCCLLGREIVLGASTFHWASDNLTGATTFFDEPIGWYAMKKYQLDATDIGNGKAYFQVTGSPAQYVRVFLSALTGTGLVTVKYFPTETM
jgi:hypothetical protein